MISLKGTPYLPKKRVSHFLSSRLLLLKTKSYDFLIATKTNKMIRFVFLSSLLIWFGQTKPLIRSHVGPGDLQTIPPHFTTLCRPWPFCNPDDNLTTRMTTTTTTTTVTQFPSIAFSSTRATSFSSSTGTFSSIGRQTDSVSSIGPSILYPSTTAQQTVSNHAGFLSTITARSSSTYHGHTTQSSSSSSSSSTTTTSGNALTSSSIGIMTSSSTLGTTTSHQRPYQKRQQRYVYSTFFFPPIRFYMYSW